MADALSVDATLRIGTLSLAMTWQPQARAVALVGPSGSGKSSTLRVLAGVERRATGTVCFGATIWQDARIFVPPWRRRVGWVPQESCLFPHLRVRANLAYAGATDAEVTTIARRLAVDHLLDRAPRHLSGGERQRVALGRAILARPQLLLLDEPFAALDDALRARVSAEVASICAEQEIPLVVVSHHAADVASLATERWRISEGGFYRE